MDLSIAYLQRCPAAPECPSCSLTCPSCPSFSCPPPASVSCPACPALVCPAPPAEAARPREETAGEPVASCPACAACEKPEEQEACDSWGAFLRGLLVGAAGGGVFSLVVVKLIGHGVGVASVRRGRPGSPKVGFRPRGAIGF